LGALVTSLMFGAAMPASAQVGQAAAPPADEPTPAPDEQPEIVVTGSLIRGTSEAAALPVDVISADEIADQGSPSVLDLIKRLPVAAGTLGDQNQFDSRAQQAEGVVSVNLRGLGPSRTLVLLNGMRLAQAPIGTPAVDVSLMPIAAIGRVEVLKDGAAATYGSDAIGGVVNFITNDRLKGLVLSGDYKFLDGSDGEWSASAAFGHDNGAGLRFLASVGYQHRSPLPARERDFISRPYAENPQGGFTLGGNPTSFIPFRIGAPIPGFPTGIGATAGLQLDRGCQPLGGTVVVSSGAERCANQYTPYDVLVDKEDRLQAYGEVEIGLGEGLSLTLTGLFGQTDVVSNTSPTYLVLNAPSQLSTGLPFALNQIFVPANNPGLVAYRAANPGQFPLGATNALLALGTFRTELLGGNSIFNANGIRGAAPSERKTESGRFTATLDWKITSDLRFALNFLHHNYRRENLGYDTVVDRLQLALRGFGGESCNRAANTPGANGCLFFNPFSNAVQSNAQTGQTNPAFNPALANSPDVLRYITRPSTSNLTNKLTVAEAIVSGSTGLSLPGGNISFALGGQYRKLKFEGDYGAFNDINENPCPGSLEFNVRTCPTRSGLFGFLGATADARDSGDVRAAFGELQFPVSDNLNVQVAARYEDYGGSTGSTFNPQGRVRWQATPWLALRGGVGSTFRGPPITILQPGDFVTSLQFIGGSFRAVEVRDNPSITPETAITYNAGVILEHSGLRASVDYFRYDFKRAIIAEPVGGLRRAVFGGTDVASALANCASPFIGRFTFSAGACVQGTTNLGNVTRVATNYINGADLVTSGLDFIVDWRRRLSSRASIGLGGTATYTFNYRIDDLALDGVVLEPGFDAVGRLNYQTTAYPLPEFRGQAYAQLEYGPHNLRATVNHVGSYADQRFAPPELGYKIKAFTTVDLAYRVSVLEKTDLTLAAFNIFDKDPPFARLDFNYDPFTASPLGRQLKVGLTTRF
jgi:iron complex outermembrane receptor protein